MSSNQTKSRGSDFERAVHAFVAKFSKGARIIFDHKVLDRDTRRSRQVDVWVEAKIAELFPISIYISCKGYSRKVNVQQMGTFINEVQSTAASTGVIYARSGFSDVAIEKAKAYGMSCCRLYENEPADIPEVLVFQHFVSRPQVQHRITCARGAPQIHTWGELYDLALRNGETVASLLDKTLRVLEEKYLETRDARVLPKGTNCSVTLELHSGGSIGMDVILRYANFRGKTKAQLIDGSYCLTDGSFIGSQTSPVIDTWSPHPGPGWEPVEADARIPANAICMVFKGGEPFEKQMQALRAKPLDVEALADRPQE